RRVTTTYPSRRPANASPTSTAAAPNARLRVIPPSRCRRLTTERDDDVDNIAARRARKGGGPAAHRGPPGAACNGRRSRLGFPPSRQQQGEPVERWPSG